MIQSGVESRFIVKEVGGKDTVVIFLKDSYMNYASSDVLKPRLKNAVSEKIEKGRLRFVLNLANVGVMDSCGLAVLISLKKLIDGRGGRLILSNMSAMIQRLFALTKLDSAFEIHPSEEEAIEA